MKTRYILFILLLALYKLITPTIALAAPRLFLDPATKTVGVNEELTVSVKIDTAGEQTLGANASLNFDSEFFELQNVNPRPNLYQTQESNYQAGWIYIDGIQHPPVPLSGSGDLGNFTLKAKKEGNSKVTFNCTAGNLSDSNILDTQANDIIDCSATAGGDYTIGEGAQPEPTAQPTSPPGDSGNGGNGNGGGSGGNGGGGDSSLPPTNTPPPQLPESGVITDTLKVIGTGIGFVIMGLVLIL